MHSHAKQPENLWHQSALLLLLATLLAALLLLGALACSLAHLLVRNDFFGLLVPHDRDVANLVANSERPPLLVGLAPDGKVLLTSLTTPPVIASSGWSPPFALQVNHQDSRAVEASLALLGSESPHPLVAATVTATAEAPDEPPILTLGLLALAELDSASVKTIPDSLDGLAPTPVTFASADKAPIRPLCWSPLTMALHPEYTHTVGSAPSLLSSLAPTPAEAAMAVAAAPVSTEASPIRPPGSDPSAFLGLPPQDTLPVPSAFDFLRCAAPTPPESSAPAAAVSHHPSASFTAAPAAPAAAASGTDTSPVKSLGCIPPSMS